MTRRRRGVILAGLALLLGGLAASDVAGRESALRRRLGADVEVVVARRPIRAGARLTPAALAVRRVPALFAPRSAIARPEALAGLRAAVAIPAGADVPAAAVANPAAAPGAPVRPGERVADVVAVGARSAIAAGGRVDVLVTREASGGGAGRTSLALEDVEVLSVGGAPSAGAGDAARAPRVRASLRVTLRQAVFLAAAQSFATEIRLLPRAAGDRAHQRGSLTVGSGL